MTARDSLSSTDLGEQSKNGHAFHIILNIWDANSTKHRDQSGFVIADTLLDAITFYINKHSVIGSQYVTIHAMPFNAKNVTL